MGQYDDLITLAVGGIAVYFLISTCTLQGTVGNIFSSMGQPNPLNDIFKQIEGMIGVTGCGDFPGGTTTAPGGTAPPTGGGGGGISGDATCPGGETCVLDNDGTRMECDAEKGDSYEATWCGSFSGDQMTIKLYGPGHGNDGNCCWCNIIVHEDGSFQTGGEGPHSPNTNCEHNTGSSIGGSSNVCIKATVQPGPTIVGYGLVNGQWQEMVRRTGPCGCSETSNVKTGNQVAFRCDGNMQTTCATVKPLGPGGITPPAATPPPASGNGDGNGNGGGGGTTPTPTPTNPNRPAPNNPADPCIAFKNSPGTWCGCRTARGLSCANYARSSLHKYSHMARNAYVHPNVISKY